eukprot:748606-Hanusia_phi.AAC.2
MSITALRSFTGPGPARDLEVKSACSKDDSRNLTTQARRMKCPLRCKTPRSLVTDAPVPTLAGLLGGSKKKQLAAPPV